MEFKKKIAMRGYNKRMFGLMRHAPRLPYCGTCKTMGALFGQRSRVFLNHDVVFLAELLLESSVQPEWGVSYRSFNCLSLPKNAAEMPLALQYAAAVNVALAHFHIADHRSDSSRALWRWAARWISPSYRRAAARLRELEFPLDAMAAILATQKTRESEPTSLAHLAKPTAIATAMVLSHGACLVGRPDLASSLFALGKRFGYLIYVLDALEDRDRDAKSGAFNALARFPEIDAKQEILAVAAELERELPAALADRLRANLEERLGMRPRVLHHRCSRPPRDRWRSALAFARSLRDRERAGFLKGAAVLASTAALAYLFPHHARRAESWKECLGLPMNLMALGSVFAAAAPPPPPPPPEPPAPPGGHRPFNPHMATPSSQPGPPNIPSIKSGCFGCCGDCCVEAACEGCCSSCDCG